jgi:hypothetical protein
MATKYDLNKPLLDEDGKEVKDLTLAKSLAGLIFNSVSTEVPYKLFEMGLQLKKDGILTIDTTDKDMLTAFIERSPNITNLGKGRILEVLFKK